MKDGALLAVDLGLRTGLAAYGRGGRLRWYRSTHLATVAQLKRAAFAVVRDLPELAEIVVEGDRQLGNVWERLASRRGLGFRRVSPETWREALLLPRERRSGEDAKRHADGLAHRVIAWSDAKRPRGALRHDVAEAIVIGLWGVLDLGWLSELPPELRAGT